jgi:hypothetical protein
MFKNRSFENVHRNHKFAFLDGLLCGVVLALMGRAFRDDLHEMY